MKNNVSIIAQENEVARGLQDFLQCEYFLGITCKKGVKKGALQRLFCLDFAYCILMNFIPEGCEPA